MLLTEPCSEATRGRERDIYKVMSYHGEAFIRLRDTRERALLVPTGPYAPRRAYFRGFPVRRPWKPWGLPYTVTSLIRNSPPLRATIAPWA